MLRLKMWAIVRIKWLWIFWILHLMKKYQRDDMMTASKRRQHARYLWNAFNKGMPPSMRFTPLQTLNASYYQDALWEGDFTDKDESLDK